MSVVSPPPQGFSQMNTTSMSLLQRLRRPGEERAWERFVHLYTPLLFFWCRRTGLAMEDSRDLVQEVLAHLVRKLPEFEYQPDKSFRGWLRTLTINKWRERGRKKGISVAVMDAGLSQVPGDQPDPFEEVEYRRHLVQHAVKIMQSEFEPRTWQACWETVVEGRGAPEVAQELGVSLEVVYAAKSRVLKRLREELAGLLD
jgi:RNA polymerase sigma-70 factor (ECF subfamily)